VSGVCKIGTSWVLKKNLISIEILLILDLSIIYASIQRILLVLINNYIYFWYFENIDFITQ